MATKNDVMNISIEPIEYKTFTVKVVGDSPLIVHKWSEKAKKMILDKQMKKASKGREARDPWMEYCESLYWLNGMPENPTEDDIANAKFYFPVVAFKAAAVDGGYQSGAIPKKTTARAAFQIVGDKAIIDGTPHIREDMVHIGMGTSDLRYRGEFTEWSTMLTIKYNERAMSAEQIINLLNIGGFACGVGEWRPQKDGQYGTFHVE